MAPSLEDLVRRVTDLERKAKKSCQQDSSDEERAMATLEKRVAVLEQTPRPVTNQRKDVLEKRVDVLEGGSPGGASSGASNPSSNYGYQPAPLPVKDAGNRYSS